MHDDIYPIFKFLADLPVTLNSPVNFWFWLLFLVAPGLVFFVNVERSRTEHVTRVLCAIGLTYILLNLSLHAQHAFDWRDYEVCQEQSVHKGFANPEAHEECRHHLMEGDGAKNVFAFVLGWIPAAFYIGIWEIFWRIKHRKKIREMGKNYKGKWLSNITMLLTFIPFIFYFFPWLFFV